jgi:hypothetical protein
MGGAMSSIVISGDTSGSVTLHAPAAAGTTTLTLPTTTDTLVGKATVDTLTNKTLVAPALGTPVSGDLTNCTGIPLSWTQIGATQTASASAFIDFTSVFDTTYSLYVARITDLLPTTDDRNLQIQFYQSTLQTGSSYDFHEAIQFSSSPSNTYISVTGENSAVIKLNEGQGNLATDNSSMLIWFANPSSATTHKRIWWQGAFENLTPTMSGVVGSGAFNGSTAAVDGFRLFYEASSTIASGTATIYGVS